MGTFMNSKNIDASLFQRFMNAYSSISGQVHYSGSIENVKDADAIVLIGAKIASDSPNLYETLKLVSKKESSKIVYAHPIEDAAMQKISTQFMKYEPGSEEGVLALLAYHILKDVNLSEMERTFLDDLDLAYLEAESNTGEEEFDELIESVGKSNKRVLIVGNDLMAHHRAENIAKICAMIEKNSAFSLLIVSDSQEVIGQDSSKECLVELEEVEDLPEYNGTVIYNLNPTETSESSLLGSAQFAQAARISDGDYVSIVFAGQAIEREFKIDNELKGTIAINPTFDINVEARRYKFERSEIKKINQRVRVS